MSIFAGSGANGNAGGYGKNAQFSHPGALAIDSSDNIFVADYDYGIIRKITPNGNMKFINITYEL